MATDALGNLYLGDPGNNAFKELANAYVTAAPISQGVIGGSGNIQVYPANRDLTGQACIRPQANPLCPSTHITDRS